MHRKETIFLRRSRPTTTKWAVLMVVLAAALSLVAAATWQLHEQPDVPAAISLTESSSGLRSVSEPVSGVSAAPSDPPQTNSSSEMARGDGQSHFEGGLAPASQADGLSSAVSDETAEPSNRLPQTPEEDDSYFNDAVFVGDSITTGIKLYDVMANAAVLASTGVNLDTIFTKKAVELSGEPLTVMEALDRGNYAKIYIMLGANGAAYLSCRQILSRYEEILDHIIANHPTSLVYVQSILPVHEQKYFSRYGVSMSNAVIDDINAALRDLTAQKGVYYVDVASAFKDAQGGMPDDQTPDGIHINTAGYAKWFSYLKTHTAEVYK
jgi:lysophospholipase L1-like esterase